MIELIVERGAHLTVRAPESMALVHKDVAYQADAGFTEVVLWDDIKDTVPKNFKISPLAVESQNDRRRRIILEPSFPVRQPAAQASKRKMGAVVVETVSDTTSLLTPQEPFRETGKVLPQLFHFMAAMPEHEEIRFSKVDLSDRFWRLIVDPLEKWNFSYVMPDPPGSPIRIIVPSALQMGWMESPAYCCTATETSGDIINMLLQKMFEIPEQPLIDFLMPTHNFVL